jgi:DNA-directed RNA polymerase subunit RPC12/RpoP
MPLFHCISCHHEWEGIAKGDEPTCDWCGSHGYILEEKTPLELMVEEMEKANFDIEKFLKLPDAICKQGRNPFYGTSNEDGKGDISD